MMMSVAAPLHFRLLNSFPSPIPCRSRHVLLLSIFLFFLTANTLAANDKTVIMDGSSSSESVEQQEQQPSFTRSSSAPTSNNVSSHVLDIAQGVPAEGVGCIAWKWMPNDKGSGGHWALWGRTKTDATGRIPIVHPGQPLTVGQFKLHFQTKEYFEQLERETFYPYIEVVFQVDDPTRHYHVPITLSNFGYSTYKGQ